MQTNRSYDNLASHVLMWVLTGNESRDEIMVMQEQCFFFDQRLEAVLALQFSSGHPSLTHHILVDSVSFLCAINVQLKNELKQSSCDCLYYHLNRSDS